MIEAFQWSDRFAVGITSVDEQHQQLFKLINEVGNMVIDKTTATDEAAARIIQRLAAYAQFHFTDEERVWQEGALELGEIAAHKEAHRAFTYQVMTMWEGRTHLPDAAKTLYEFLSAWLVYHILGDDQAMARKLTPTRGDQVAAVEVPANIADDTKLAHTALLQAMQTLYGVVAAQNESLLIANRDLEARVTARTAELDSAYKKLAADHQRLAELLAKVELTQRQLLQSEKMASIGQLAAGVAHEINNPIGFVSSNLKTLGHYAKELLRVVDAAGDSPAAQAMAEEVGLDFLREDLVTLLAESNDGLDRVRKIVGDLKDFSHVGEVEWQQADLLVGLEKTLSILTHELKYKTEIVRELVPLPWVRCIPAQINQVFVNLLINAVQAIPEHGIITLKSGRAGDEVWVEVGDNGMGMSEDTKRRIFEPFFTTKPVGKGTGLGMSLAYDIVTKHGGRLEIDSAPGNGARIRICLPIGGPS